MHSVPITTDQRCTTLCDTVFQFPPPITLTANKTEIVLKVPLNTSRQTYQTNFFKRIINQERKMFPALTII